MNITPKTEKLARAVRLTLAAAALATAFPATAALQDHGAQDPTLVWPQWYRDNSNNGVDGGGLALGLCRSQLPSPDPLASGAPMCFPIVSNPVGFAGNLGDEIFYTNLNVNVTNGGLDLRYVMSLEAAYGTVNPVGAPVHGQEVVFARTRFVMHVTPGSGCSGTYRVIHPYGDETFPDVPEGRRALFATLDIPVGAILDFDTVVRDGQIAPFLHWDDGDEHVLSRTNPLANPNGEILSVTPTGGVQQQFIGDPSVLHTFTGSPLIETVPGTATPLYFLADGITPAHQNYVKVIAPPTCDIGGTPVENGGEGINVNKVNTGFLMGQVWTAPIPTPTTVTQAKFSRTANDVTIDVWAKSSVGQTLLATGAGLRGAQFKPDPSDLSGKKYEVHLVLPAVSTVIPPSVNVVNTTSNPVLNINANLTDYLTVNKAEYDRSTQKLCVSAKSSDATISSLNLGYTGLAGTVLLDATAKDGCPAAVAGDFTASVSVDPAHAPAAVSVTSGVQGSEAAAEVSVKENTQDNSGLGLVAVNDNVTTDVNNNAISGGAPSDLAVTENDTVAPGSSVVVVDQPYTTVDQTDQLTGKTKTVKVGIGTATANANNTIHFVPNPGTVGTGTLSYLLKYVDPVSGLAQVSSLAQVGLTNITFQPTAPATSPDNFAIFRTNTTTGFTANVLANDVAAAGSPIDPASILVSSAANGDYAATATTAQGTVTVNANGTVTFKTKVGAAAANDVFFYTVKATANGVSSAATAPVRVDVVVETNNELINITRNRFVNQAGIPRWDVRFTTSWFGAPLTTTGTCYVTRTSDAARVVTNWGFSRPIGTGPADGTGAVQLAALTTKMINDPTYNPAVDVPKIPSKWSYTVQCMSNSSTVIGGSTNNASTLTQP
jgi:hypothetical protein